MKIAIKKEINFRNDDQYSNEELSLVIVHFNSEENNSDFIFKTIDFHSDIAYNPDEEFIDLLYSVCHIYKLDYDFYVLEYNAQGITFAPQECESCQPKFKIDTLTFGRALLTIHQTNDFAFLEEHLVPLSYPTISLLNAETDHQLTTIENYLKEHPAEIKRVYYPGAAIDFSPLQLFGKHIDGVDVFYTDYMSNPEIDRVVERLENNIKASILSPQDFKQESWEDFWPTNVSRDEMLGHNPTEAWGRKFEFQSKDLDCTLTYLGTEGVQTAKILCENQLVPDVLVLQDHGYGGNYASFGGDNSFLHQAMQHCLPKYILMDPKEKNNQLWPGYEQVTQAYLPKDYASLPQNGNSRALFKIKSS